MFNRYVDDFDRTFALMNQVRRRIDRAFEPFDGDLGGRATLKDQGTELTLEVELPGVDEKDVVISIHEETLTLGGERKSGAPEGYFVHRRERAPVELATTIGLPCKVDPDKSSAVLKNGVMTVRLVKVPAAQPRRISVQAN